MAVRQSLSKQYPHLEQSERDGHWVWIVKRLCEACKQPYRIVAGDTRRPPSLGPGAIRCNCGGLVHL